MGTLVVDDTRQWHEYLDLALLVPREEADAAEPTNQREADEAEVLAVVAKATGSGRVANVRVIRAEPRSARTVLATPSSDCYSADSASGGLWSPKGYAGRGSSPWLRPWLRTVPVPIHPGPRDRGWGAWLYNQPRAAQSTDTSTTVASHGPATVSHGRPPRVAIHGCHDLRIPPRRRRGGLMPVPDHSRRYGTAHRQARAQYLAGYLPGTTPCALCREPMSDWPSTLDLAHDESGVLYLGLAHRRCNRGYNQAETNRTRATMRDPLPRSNTRW